MGRFPKVKPQAGPSLLEADQANKVYEFLNALEDLQVSPQGYGKLTFGKKNAVLDLSAIQQAISKVNAALTAMNQTTGSGTTPGPVTLTQLAAKMNEIIAALNAATVVCNPNDTVTLNIPNIPSPFP